MRRVNLGHVLVAGSVLALVAGTALAVNVGSIGEPELAEQAVTTSRLRDGAVSSAKVAWPLSSPAPGSVPALGIGRVPSRFSLEVADSARIGDTWGQIGETLPLYLRANWPTLGFNVYYDGSIRYGSNGFGAEVFMEGSSGDLILDTQPSGTAGAVIGSRPEGIRIKNNGAGILIGGSGLIIKQVLYATLVWNPGTITGGGNAAVNSMTVSGAAAGNPCFAGVYDPAPLTGHHVQCITTTNLCALAIRCQQAANCVLGSATFWCVVLKI